MFTDIMGVTVDGDEKLNGCFWLWWMSRRMTCVHCPDSKSNGKCGNVSRTMLPGSVRAMQCVCRALFVIRRCMTTARAPVIHKIPINNYGNIINQLTE